MDYKMLKELVLKYFEGETSITEELLLKNELVKYSGYDTDLLEAKFMLSAFVDNEKEQSDLSFEAILKSNPKHKLRKMMMYASSIAAALIIMLTIGNLLINPSTPVVYAYVNGVAITDKQEAIKQAQIAMGAVSNNLNKGTKGLNQLSKINKPLELLTVKNN